MQEEKATRKVYKNAERCFKQILRAAPNKTTVVWPSNSHLTSHPRNTSKKRCINNDNLISDVFSWNLIHEPTKKSLRRLTKT